MLEEKSRKYMSKSELFERLIIFIKENDLQEGEKLPSERALCKMWDANRSTLRSTLHKLVEDGYLDALHGKGYYIRKKKIVRNLQDMKSLKLLVNEQERELITKVIKQEVISADKKFAEKFKIQEGDPILELVRVRYIDGEPKLLEYNYADLTRCQGLEKVDFSEIPFYLALELKYDLIPHRGYQEISITRLREDESVLFMKPENSPAIYMQGVTFDKKDEEIPIEIFKSIAEPKTFSFISHMKVVQKEKGE